MTKEEYGINALRTIAAAAGLPMPVLGGLSFPADLFEVRLTDVKWSLIRLEDKTEEPLLDVRSPWVPDDGRNCYRKAAEGFRGQFVRTLYLPGGPLVQGASEDLRATAQALWDAMGTVKTLEGYPSPGGPALSWAEEDMREEGYALAQALHESARGFVQNCPLFPPAEEVLFVFSVQVEWEIHLQPSAPVAEWSRSFSCSDCGSGDPTPPVPLTWATLQAKHEALSQEPGDMTQVYCAWRTLMVDTRGCQDPCPDCESEEVYTCDRHTFEFVHEQALEYAADVLGYNVHTP